MTTLFNLFCPFVEFFNLEISVVLLMWTTFIICLFLLESFILTLNNSLNFNFSNGLFSMVDYLQGNFMSFFLFLAFLNLISLVTYSYPVTTTLGLNFSVAFFMWFISVSLLSLKSNSIASLLPENSPWYLSPFLGIVEFVSILVRPITLCFRLLANMSAGHILLSLIAKMSYFLWTLGILFGLLELMVAMVQSFVFLMLISVYLQESLSH